MPKIKFGEWKERLEAIMREAGDDASDYDRALSSNYWRESYSPKEFYKEILAAEKADRDEMLDLKDLF